MKVLIACEFSGRVRDAFIAKGHDAMSCDILPTEAPGPHYQGDVRDLLDQPWDLMIAHPPCTYLANSGVQWLHKQEGRWAKMYEGVDFFLDMLNAPIPRLAVENPVPHKYAKALIGSPTQYIQPYDFGTLETKKTGLWLKNLPPLVPTHDGKEETMRRPKSERMPGWWGGSKGGRSGHFRSITALGIAQAMADQWGSL